jgi:hypothetical protein
MVYEWMRPMFERYGYDPEGAELATDIAPLAASA